MKTKIVATLGPASSSYEVLIQLVKAGVDVFRLNFSHSSHEEHEEVIKTIRKVNADLGSHVAILADLQGPKIRIGLVEGGSVMLEDGQEIMMTTKECLSNTQKLFITYPEFAADVTAGENLLVDDGKLMFTVLETNCMDEVRVKVVKGGRLSSKKGVNLPDTKTSVPSLTEKDLKDLDFILRQGDIHWIALSFVRSANDILLLRHEMETRNTSENIPGIVAKIEKPEAVENIDSIIEATDGIMVARGDLGVELPMERVPMVQKSIVNKCITASKPVIIATQMMEGMIENIRPTRAEVNDVANSVMDGADAVMLSGETSVGLYPVQVVETMQRIIHEVEAYAGIYNRSHTAAYSDPDRMISDTILFSGCDIAQKSGAKAIIAFTHKGYSAFRISSQRPNADIFIFSGDAHLIGKLSLVWGVKAFYLRNIIHSTTKTFRLITEKLKEEGYVKEGDLLVNIASTPVYISGKTNMLKLSIA